MHVLSTKTHLLLCHGCLGDTDALLPPLGKQQVQTRGRCGWFGNRQQPHDGEHVAQHLRQRRVSHCSICEGVHTVLCMEVLL